MVNHVNVYENLNEAHQRLMNTIIQYDGEPFRVVAITDHREQKKVFSIYLLPIPYEAKDYPTHVDHYDRGSRDQGGYLDTWIKERKDCKLLRKDMNSPKFNRFRPFSLGMINEGGSAKYLQRQPQRTRESGLSRGTVLETTVTIDGTGYEGPRQTALECQAFRDCVLGVYPSYAECVRQLKNPDILNTSVAFHRSFAIIKGPLDLFFLSYKAETIGLIQNNNELLLGRKYKHFKEVTEELNTFSRINIQE